MRKVNRNVMSSIQAAKGVMRKGGPVCSNQEGSQTPVEPIYEVIEKPLGDVLTAITVHHPLDASYADICGLNMGNETDHED